MLLKIAIIALLGHTNAETTLEKAAEEKTDKALKTKIL